MMQAVDDAVILIDRAVKDARDEMDETQYAWSTEGPSEHIDQTTFDEMGSVFTQLLEDARNLQVEMTEFCETAERKEAERRGKSE